MADPVTLAMAGAAAGAALKPKNPLQGAMLGAAAGFTGGAALGAGAGAAAAGGAGAAGAAGGALGGAGGTLGAAGLGGMGAATAAGTAAEAGLASGVGSTIGAPAMSATPFSIAQQFGKVSDWAKDNPMQAMQGAKSVQGLLTPEPMPQTAMPQVQRGQPMAPVNFAQLLSPAQIQKQPISLLG